MPRHINSAYRVHAILSVACEQPGNKHIWKVLIEAFGVTGANPRKQIAEIHRLLDMLFDEIEHAKRQMTASGFSADLYEPAFIKIEQHLDHGFMYSDWEGQKKVIVETLHTLKFCSEVLPHEEELASEEDIDGIRETLQELEDVLKESELPEYAKSFIQQHINIIKKALRDYQVIGAKAFKTAMYEGYIQSVENEAVVAKYEQSEEIGLLSKVWSGVKKVASSTLGNEKLLTAGTKLTELGLKVAEHIDKTQKS